MKTYNTQAEVSADLDRYGNLYVKDDVTFLSNIDIYGSIKARNIYSLNINAHDIDAHDIRGLNIITWDIIAWDITALNINAHDIRALKITTRDINARDISARNIDAENISYDSKCVAIETFVCESIKGRMKNAQHLCLTSEIVIKGESKMKTIEELKEEVKALQAQIETLEGVKPKPGFAYFYITNGVDVGQVSWRDDDFDKNLLAIGNVFKTYKDALDEVRRMKIRQKLKVMAGDWIPDWDDREQAKYFIYYDFSNKEFCQDYNSFLKGTIQMYFPTQEIAQTVMDTMNDDLKFLMGVK
jgi:hypothetical protein